MKLSKLNEKQKTAVFIVDNPVRLVAGAGSGKTRVLTEKIAYLIGELNYDPEKILALTFTNKAAKEMRDRVKKIIGKEAEKAQISTFHSLCYLILKEEIHHLGYKNNFFLMDASDQKDLLKKIYNAKNLMVRNYSFSDVISFISWVKNKKINFKKFFEEKEVIAIFDEYSKLNYKIDYENFGVYVKIFNSYLRRCRENNALDFDDLILKTVELFKTHSNILKKWKDKFNYILVDEFQDTSEFQYEIVKSLSNRKNIMIVGDPDQNIYGWRNANTKILNQYFVNDFKDSVTITLDQNYRSTSKILEVANKLISQNKDRLEKKLFTNNKGRQKVFYMETIDEKNESRNVVAKIAELERKGVSLGNVAILYRTNYYSRTIEEQLTISNFPYKIIGQNSFYQRRDVKDFLAYLNVIFNDSSLSFLKIINVPGRNVGGVTIKRLEILSEMYGVNLWELIKDKMDLVEKEKDKYKITPKSIISITELRANILEVKSKLLRSSYNMVKTLEDFFVNKIGYFKSFAEKRKNFYCDSYESLMSLINYIYDWVKENKNKYVGEFLDQINLFFSDYKGKKEDKTVVSLTTFHNAKGLEFDYVFIIGLCEKIIPNFKIKDKYSLKFLEEERRVLYVGITRAKKGLYMFSHRGAQIANYTNNYEVSRFIKEMELKSENQDRDVANLSNLPTDKKSVYYKKNMDFILGSRIYHLIFGEGEVVEVGPQEMKVVFDKFPGETKTLIKNHRAIKKI